MRALGNRHLVGNYLVLGVALIGWIGLPAVAADFIWLEGEAAQTSAQVSRSGWGRPEFLSERNWLHVTVEEDKVEKGVPDEGILLEYKFQNPKAGRYEIWNRLGFEFARSPFEWRLDDRAWQTAKPTDLTTDLMELAFWAEVAWLKLGEDDVTAGEHRLQIRLPKLKDEKGKWQRVLYASDVICLHEGPFHPYKACKPGQDHSTDADRAAATHVFQLLATLTGTTNVGLAVKRHGTWTAVYSALPGGFTPRFLRGLAREAGLTPTGPEDDVTFAGCGFLTIHALSDGDKTLQWNVPADVTDLTTGQTLARGVDRLTIPMKARETRWFARGDSIR